MTSKSITVRNYHTEIPGKIVDNAWTFPTCISTNTHGKQLEWTIIVRAIRLPDPTIPLIDITESMFIPLTANLFDNQPLDPTICGYIRVNSLQTGGKVRKTPPDIIKAGKGVGKAKTNTFCQALRDAYGKYNKQLKNSSAAPTPFSIQVYPPMLAQVLNEQVDHPLFPNFIQRKYNGLRAVIALDGANPIIYSRKLNPIYGFETIRSEAAALLRTLVNPTELFLDGELYKHGVPLQTISGVARKKTQTDEEAKISEHIDFMIYDCFLPSRPDLKFSERRAILQGLFEGNNTRKCQLVETIIVNSDAEIQQFYKSALAEGFEGAMVRSDSPYQYSYNNHHSKYLLKIKETFDAEYRVIGWEVGAHGKAANALMIICETDGNAAFTVTPAMPILAREALAQQMSVVGANGKTFFENTYQNKRIIVYFDEKSIAGIPQRARTELEIRTWD